MCQKGRRGCCKVTNRQKLIHRTSDCGVLTHLIARVAVHFQSISEKLSPYDTVFSFNTPIELKESILSSACSLHTASASVKSSTDSLRPPPLTGIAEDAHENQIGVPDDRSVNEGRGRSAGSEDAGARLLAHKDLTDRENSTRTSSAGHTPSPRSTRTIRNTDKALPPTPPELQRKKGGSRTTFEGEESLSRPSLDARPSFQSSRPPTRDLQLAYEYKPKVKLGPRPSVDLAGRPFLSDSPRPISTLPAGVRIPTRQVTLIRPKSQQSQKSAHHITPVKLTFSSPFPALPIDLPDTPFAARPNGAVSPVKTIRSKPDNITPEKRRLMKALQLRQKQLAAQTSPQVYERESLPATPVFELGKSLSKSLAEEFGAVDEMSRIKLAIEDTNEESETMQVFIKDMNQPSSTNVESSPISVPEASDGPSTQASSITDEEETSISRDAKLTVNTELTSWPSDHQSPGKANDSLSHSPLTAVNVDLNDSPPVPEWPPYADSLIVDEGIVLPQEVPLPSVDRDEELELASRRSSCARESPSKNLLQTTDEHATQQPCTANQAESPSQDSDATRPSTSDTIGDHDVDRIRRPHGLSRFGQRPSSSGNSDDQFLSDDSFMEELRSATVQEAKPMSVSISKSPITPVSPRFPSEKALDEMAKPFRSVSSPLQDGSKEISDLISSNPPPLSSRSFSASHRSTNAQSQQASAIMLKKAGVSSGISQRIKALEKLSSRPTSPSSQVPPTSALSSPPPAFVSFRKASINTPVVTAEVVQTSNHKTRFKIPQSLKSSKSSSPKDASVGRKDESANVRVESKPGKPRRESTSAAATTHPVPATSANLSEPAVPPLYDGPPTVAHRAMEVLSPHIPFNPFMPKSKTTRSISASSTERKSEPQQATRRDSSASRRSIASARGSETVLSRSISETSLSVNGPEGTKEDKKESRTARLLKRMSGISSASRRSIVHALNSSVKDEPLVEHHETVYEAPQAIAAFGDVNVQFPDTLVRWWVAFIACNG